MTGCAKIPEWQRWFVALSLLCGVFAGACNEAIHTVDIRNIRCEDNDCRLLGTITEDTVLTADKNWLLVGAVFIGAATCPATLTIESGTVIRGDAATYGTLVISMGSKIIAEGSVDAPIVFTSNKPLGERAPGDWGGVVLNGRARQNQCIVEEEPCMNMGMGMTGDYGGEDDEDDSGILRYVRIEFAGRHISYYKEIDGLTFHAVGSGTTIDYVQIHKSEDDGIAFFGGNVDVRHVLVTGALDDGFDWSDGWRGRAQFVVVQQHEGRSDNGLEADNNQDFPQSEPRSAPTLANLTLIGAPDSSEGSDVGFMLRGGTGVRLYSSVAAGFREACLDVDDDETFSYATSEPEEFSIAATMLDCDEAIAENDQLDENENPLQDPWNVEDFFSTGENSREIESLLIRPFDATDPDFRPSVSSPLHSGAVLPAESFFEAVEFVGAMGEDDWTAGWAAYPEN